MEPPCWASSDTGQSTATSSLDSHDPQRENAWIAELEGEPVGCVFCVRRDDATAQLRILLVDPKGRGLGTGRRLVSECIRSAKRAGYRKMML